MNAITVYLHVLRCYRYCYSDAKSVKVAGEIGLHIISRLVVDNSTPAMPVALADASWSMMRMAKTALVHAVWSAMVCALVVANSVPFKLFLKSCQVKVNITGTVGFDAFRGQITCQITGKL